MLPSYWDWKYVLRMRLKGDLLRVLSALRLRGCTRQLLRQWKGIKPKSDRVAVLIAGGPSFTDELAKAVMSARDVVDVFAINFFCRSAWANSLRPDFYVLSDPAHLSGGTEELRSWNAMLAEYLHSGDDIRLIAPVSGNWDRFKTPHIRFDDAEAYGSSNTDPRFPRGYPSNTAFKAIAVAQSLGYRRIYVFGLDYDYPRKLFVSETNKVMLREEHHYGVRDADYSIHFASIAHALNWWSYDFRRFAILAGKGVYNVTKTSLIDFFPRISPESFIETVNRRQL
jgi:hypothetical protein